MTYPWGNIPLGNIQCPKRIVNGGYDIFVSIISNFQRWQKFQFIKFYWNLIIFEKRIVSLNILVDLQLFLEFLLWVLITHVANRTQMY